MSTILTIIIVVGLALGLVFYFKGKGEKPSPKRKVSEPQTRAKTYAAVKIALPLSGGCCESAQELLGRRIAKREALALPLSGCTMKDECQCSYETEHLTDRRSGEDRRTGNDRRDSIRFEVKTDRRSGNERRKSSRIWTDREH